MTAMTLRSHRWFYGQGELGLLHRGALRQLGFDMDAYGGEAVIGIGNTWSELNPCNAGLREVAEAVKRGVKRAGAIPLEFPLMSLGEDLMKPTALLYRNLLAMETEECLRAHPIDGVVLLGNCDKTLPALLMGAASADLPTLVLAGGPRRAGVFRGKALGSGTDLWRLADEVRAGRMTDEELRCAERALSCGPGACNVMGTASTMAALTEALGLMPPGTAFIGAEDPRRLTTSEDAGERIVAMVHEGLVPSRILTETAFDDATRLLAALGGSTNAVIHLLAIAGRRALDFDLDRIERLTREIPCLADVEPSGRHLVHALDAKGGVPALMRALAPVASLEGLTVTGRTWREEMAASFDDEVVRPLHRPVASAPALAVLRGNLAPRGALIKVAAASPGLLRHRGPALVFDGYEDMLARIDDPALPVTPDSVLVLRYVGPKGAPGMPEWGAIPLPRQLQARGLHDMVRISDARMSGTAFGTVVLHAAPEAALGGPLALVRDGDLITLDVAKRRLDVAVPEDEWRSRQAAFRPRPTLHRRGYPRLFLDHVLQADLGCDFDFLRPTGLDELPFVEPVVGRS